MDGISGSGTNVGFVSRTGANELSFSSNTSSHSSKLNRTSQGSIHRISGNRLGRNFTDTPYDFVEDDDERNEADDRLEYDTSGLAIPRLRTSMTPWRSVERTKKRESKQSSPTTSRPTTRNSLFSVDGGYTVTSSGGSNEVEHLQKQLTTYKLKVRTLLELIKQLNYGDDEQNIRDSFYGKLLATMSQYDEIEDLKRCISKLEDESQIKQKLVFSLQEELTTLRQQLLETKKEHAETLDYANEYLEHSEVLANNVDEMLTLLMDNLNVSDEERDALQKARQISSSFAMVKMNAVMSTLKSFLKELKSNQGFQDGVNADKSSSDAAIANSTTIDDMEKATVSNQSPVMSNENDATARDTSCVIDESIIDTRLEIAIEGLHEEYDRFIQSIREKMESSADLEKLLLNKLSEQDRLLGRISTRVKGDQNSDSHSIENKVTNYDSSAISRMSESYQDHIDDLNTLVDQLKTNLDEKNGDLELLKDRLQEFISLQKSEQRLKMELQDHVELSKVKERNWENFTNDLEKTVNILQTEKIRLLDIVDQMNAEMDLKVEKLHKATLNLKQSLQLSNNQVSALKKENKNREHSLQENSNKINSLTTECSNLQKVVSEYKKRTSWSQKYEREFQRLKQHLLLHLETMFGTLGKILQQKSIEQSKRKLEVIRRLNGINEVNLVQSKLESLYNFAETALESIIDSYMRMIIAEKGKSRQSSSGNNIEMQLRIEELERKWVSERERRKLDNDAASMRISQLEAENELLREKVYDMTIRK